ncbi:MAG: GNAT family N-acetyltransferase [Ardenticatenaceae bacterium]|nr:GNAT family N-acetyltransferase [Ardenticatenaceae bacterium]
MLRITSLELAKKHLPFLLDLWHIPEVMRYADEFPGLRGWTKKDGPLTAWTKYCEKRAAFGKAYTQFILQLPDGKPVGESFFAPLPEGYKFGKWKKPPETLCLMGDIKLLRPYWGRGLGTEAIKQVVGWLFMNTFCSLLLVPPHRKNPAAERVYEKADFELVSETKLRRGHRLMSLSRERYQLDTLD